MPSGIEYAGIICGTNNIDYNEASSIANGLICVPLTLVTKSFQEVMISGILARALLTPSEETKSKK